MLLKQDACVKKTTPMTDLPPSPVAKRDSNVKPDHESTYSTPRWVKVFGIIALVVVLLLIILMLSGGEHGPWRHTPPSSAIEYGVQQP
jgi:hypothetical protein